MSSDDSDPWTHRLGILAWAPSPFHNQVSRNQKKPMPFMSMWPCILYPSWSKAMLQSGIISNVNATVTNANQGKIKLIGCKRPIAIKDLSKNRVPSRLALGLGVNGSKYRPRVVAYYLGMEDAAADEGSGNGNGNHKPSWGSVKVDCVQQYTLESCQRTVQNMMGDDEKYDDANGNGDGDLADTDMKSIGLLYLAMQEASIAMGRPAYDPSNICKDLAIKNRIISKDSNCFCNRNDSGSVGTSTGASASAANRSSGETWKHQDVYQEGLTPENFNDWRLGGESQTNSQSQTQNFSQALVSFRNNAQ